MATIDLASLGLTADQLRDLVVERIANQVMSGVSLDEDGDEYSHNSQFARDLDAKVREHVDAKLQAIAEKHILPNVSEFMDNLVLQETNKWGEKKGGRWTLLEYLTEKCGQHMTEQVNYQGKTKSQDSYSWHGAHTRLEHMVYAFLYDRIETSVKEWLGNAHKVLGKSIEGTVRAKLAEISAKLKIDVNTGR